jgi:hypothetical protein
MDEREAATSAADSTSNLMPEYVLATRATPFVASGLAPVALFIAVVVGAAAFFSLRREDGGGVP